MEKIPSFGIPSNNQMSMALSSSINFDIIQKCKLKIYLQQKSIRFKMSKIHSLKQEKKYRNQTMTILNHMNTKTNTPTLGDRSLHSVKSIKPQVQSSRLNRPDTAKLYGKYGVNYYIGHIKEKEKRLDISEKVISSKSLQSRQGSINTHRKQTDKTKKNSYSKLQTEEAKGNQSQSWQMMMESMENNLQKRLKHVQKLFSNQGDQNLSRKDLNTSQIHATYINMKQSSQINKLKIPVQDKNPTQMIYDLNKKFSQFQSLLDQRKNKMIFDEIDNLLQAIISSLRISFIGIVDTLLKQNEQKMLNIEMSLQKIITDHEEQLAKQTKKCEKIKQGYIDQIQNLLVRSLYVNDKINTIQGEGIFNFQEVARRIDGEDNDEDQQSQLSDSIERIQQNYHSNHIYQFREQERTKTYEQYPQSSDSSQRYQEQRIHHQNLIQQANRANKHGYIQKLR